MERQNLEPVAAAVAFVETNLQEPLELSAVADAARYSKYHLHRLFTDAVGVTPHDYIRRRRLTEAAKRLVFSEAPILEVAIDAGYESQQAFTAVFKAMYKKTPKAYRKAREYYPLQAAFVPGPEPSGLGLQPPVYASAADVADWMRFLPAVVGGFPCLKEAEHLARLRQAVAQREALVLRDGGEVVGAAAFSRRTGRIDFLAAHPQYREAAGTLLDSLRRGALRGRTVSITTFRQGDRADAGQRAAYQRLGFMEAELLTEFGYPTQRLVLPPLKGGARR